MPTCTLVKETANARKGGGNYATGERWYSTSYDVTFNGLVTSIEAENATDGSTSVPAWGNTNGFLYLLEKSADTISETAGLKWRVVCTWRTLQPNQMQPNILSGHIWSVNRSMNLVPVEVPRQIDNADHAIVNVLNEPIDPPVTEVIYDARIMISFLSDQSQQTTISDLAGKCNSDAVTIHIGPITYGFVAWDLKFVNASVQEQKDADGNNILAYQYEIYWRNGGWQYEQRANMSYNKASATGVNFMTPILDVNNQAVSEPRCLNSSGVVIARNAAATVANGGILQFPIATSWPFSPYLVGII